MIISNRSAWYVVKHATWPSTFFVVVHPLPAFWNEPSSDGRVYSRTRQSSPAIQSDCCVYRHIYISVHIHAREIEENIFNFFVLFLFRPFFYIYIYFLLCVRINKAGGPNVQLLELIWCSPNRIFFWFEMRTREIMRRVEAKVCYN